MYFLENEVLLRAAISNIAELRGTKVKFKGFTMDSYRRSLNTHFRKLIGTTYSMSCTNDGVRIRIPSISIFDENYMDENTKRITDLIQAPYLSGKMGARMPPFFAYNANKRIQDLFNFRNYMVKSGYLLDSAQIIDNHIFNTRLTNVTYRVDGLSADTNIPEEQRDYHNFVRDLAFEYPTAPYYSDSNVPELGYDPTYIYYHKENIFLVNLTSVTFDPDRSTGIMSISVPAQALLDREFLILLAKVCGGLSDSDD
jgi:hypothetical protein